MFMKTLRAQTTEEQKELFLRPAERYEIIGGSRAGFPELIASVLTNSAPFLGDRSRLLRPD